MNLLGQLRAVAESRAGVASLKSQLGKLREDFEAEHRDLIIQINDTQQQLGIMESDFRAAAVAEWLATDPQPPKQFMPGVTIRESKVTTFDADFAFQWAREHLMALKLDEPVYRKFILMGQAPGQTTTEFTAALAQDLAKALETKE